MTLEELKVAADEMGYKLVKKPEPIPALLPCVCGRKRLDTHKQFGGGISWGYVLCCPKCGLKSQARGRTKCLIRENWNRTVLFEKEKESVDE